MALLFYVQYLDRNTPQAGLTGKAANITANIYTVANSTPSQIDSATPTEIGNGVYVYYNASFNIDYALNHTDVLAIFTMSGDQGQSQSDYAFVRSAADNVSGIVNGNIVGDLTGRALGSTTTAFVGVGAQVDVRQWLGTAVGADSAGIPNVNLKTWKNSVPNSLISGNVPSSSTISAGGCDSTAFTANALTEFGLTVWASATRLLTAGTNIVLNKGTGVTGFNDITAAQAATAMWQDLTSGGDFTTTTSIGKLLVTDIDATISSRLASASYTTPPTTAAIAAAILVTPAHLLATDANGSASATLVATGLDNIPTTAPAGVASTFREMLVQTWRRWFKRTHRDTTTITTYADNNTSVLTTQAYTVTATDEDVGAAS